LNQGPELLSFQNVIFGYDKKPLLKNVSLVVREADRIALVGPNGCGKSTLIRLALGLISPQQGAIRILGQRPRWSTHLSDLAYIGDPSHADGGLGLPFWLTTDAAVSIYRDTLVTPDAKDFETLLHKTLRISDLGDKRIDMLSAGERRRLMVYLALGKGPKLLISDEATEVVYEDDRPIILECVIDCCKRFRTSVLWVSHDADSTATVANRVYTLSDGVLNEMEEPTFLISIKETENFSEPQILNARQAFSLIRNSIRSTQSSKIEFALTRTSSNHSCPLEKL
jgi:ABC-type Mn2+/Zn2+ transport system ATPase subunit